MYDGGLLGEGLCRCHPPKTAPRAGVAPDNVVQATISSSEERTCAQGKVGVNEHAHGKGSERQNEQTLARARAHEQGQRRCHGAEADQPRYQRVIADAQPDEQGREESRPRVGRCIRAQGQPQGAEGKRSLYGVDLGAIADDDDTGRIGKSHGRGRGDSDAGNFIRLLGHKVQGLGSVEHEQKHQHRSQRTGRRLRQRYLEGHTTERQEREEIGKKQSRFLAGRVRDTKAKGSCGQLGRIERVGGGGSTKDIGHEGRQPDGHGAAHTEASGFGSVGRRWHEYSCYRLAGKFALERMKPPCPRCPRWLTIRIRWAC